MLPGDGSLPGVKGSLPTATVLNVTPFRTAAKGHLRPVASMEKLPSRPDRVGLGWRRAEGSRWETTELAGKPCLECQSPSRKLPQRHVMSGFVRNGFGTRDVLVVHIVLSLAGRLRWPVGLFFWWPKRKDVLPTAWSHLLLLILQENQETWLRARGDLLPPRTSSHRRLTVIWLQKTVKQPWRATQGLLP
jgi:hypothetical protein